MNLLSRLQIKDGDSKIVGKTQVSPIPCTRGGFGLATASGRGLGRFQAGSPLAQYNLKVCLAENGLRRKGHVAVYPSAQTQIHSHAADFAEAD